MENKEGYTENNQRFEALNHIVLQKMQSFQPLKETDESIDDEDDNSISFGELYRLSEDELNMVMRRRNSESSYPKE